MLGAAQERDGRFEDAETTFQTLLELTPNHAPALNYLGYMWAERSKNLEQALDMVRRAVSQDPDNGAYVDSLGWIYFQLGRFEEAKPHLEWAARLEPADGTVFEHLGDLYVELGEPGKARAAYRRSLDAEPTNDGVEQKLGDLEAAAGGQRDGSSKTPNKTGSDT
ncbi:MAG: tetratricopeptide repeat protein [Acidobacteriota bacterium]